MAQQGAQYANQPPPPLRPQRQDNLEPLYERFRKQRPNDFHGGPDPLIAEEWINSIESIFDYMVMEDAQRVSCAIQLLKNNARHSWASIKLTPAATNVTWNGFKELFYNKYFIEEVKKSIVAEFVGLVQGTMTVDDYVTKFEGLSRFVSWIVGNDVEKMNFFIKGLKAAIHKDVSMLRRQSFSKVVELALIYEKGIKRQELESEATYAAKNGQWKPGTTAGKGKHKRKWQQNADKRPKTDNSTAKEYPKIPKCGKMHGGECQYGTFNCYTCGKLGHIAVNCGVKPNGQKKT
ncbi:uncharacterized protein LOC112091431 [Morus notabilis]|uniref:uncharacterized protein LOC112091431 n=1 Tax=Morus notabilis TaxID=981085 RepID=UPI000CED2656|nr:uncharacterized protein LOC112091431 [Morus notabilis]